MPQLQCPNIFLRLFSQRKIPLGRSWIGFQKLLGDIFPLVSFVHSLQKNMMQVNIFSRDSSIRDLSDLNISYQLPPEWHKSNIKSYFFGKFGIGPESSRCSYWMVWILNRKWEDFSDVTSVNKDANQNKPHKIILSKMKTWESESKI